MHPRAITTKRKIEQNEEEEKEEESLAISVSVVKVRAFGRLIYMTRKKDGKKMMMMENKI